MSASLFISVTRDDVTPAMRKLIDGLADRTGLHRSIANRVEVLTRKYLRQIAPQRHDTARRLGASPTGHLSRAAESVASEADSDHAAVGVTSPGIGRVDHDIDIKPVNKNWLTIPVHLLAYGRTAWEVAQKVGRLFRPWKKGGRERARVLAARFGDQLVSFFALSKHVVVRRDRTLLPSDQQYLREAVLGARDYVRQLRRAVL